MAEIELQSERVLEDFLFEEMKDGCCPITGNRVDEVFRQFDTGSYGVIDLISIAHDVVAAHDGGLIEEGLVRIFELKKGALDTDAIAQIARYRQCVERFLLGHDTALRRACIEYVLVGNSVSLSGNACYLADSIDWLRVFTFKVSIATGIEFEEKGGWFRKGEDFAKLEVLAAATDKAKTVAIKQEAADHG